MSAGAAIPDTTIWLAIAGLGIATYAIRFSFLGLTGGRPVPEGLRRALAFVPVTVLPALVAPMAVLAPDGAPGAGAADLPRLAACAGALAAGCATRTLLGGMAGGFAGYLLAHLLL